MNRKTRTLPCRSPVRTRPPLLPGSRAPDAAGGSHGADGPTQPVPPPVAHHRGGQHHVRLGAPNSRSLAPLARTRMTAPPAFVQARAPGYLQIGTREGKRTNQSVARARHKREETIRASLI